MQIPNDIREAIRDALVQRKWDISDVCGADKAEFERLTARYDAVLSWMTQQPGSASGNA